MKIFKRPAKRLIFAILIQIYLSYKFFTDAA